MLIACKLCGKEFNSLSNRHIFCSRNCNKKRQAISARENIKEKYICKYCKKEFKPKNSDRITYCSRECAFADKAAKPKEKIKPICIKCGKQIEGRNSSKYCTIECYRQYQYEQYIKYKNSDQYQKALNEKREKYESKTKFISKVCKECGATYNAKIKQKYCSFECREKATKRNENHKRRQREIHTSIKPIYKNEILLRDKGICQLCGKKINIKYVYPHPKSLSIDHIIPLSQGGTHEPKNVQVAHFICNSKKGNKKGALYDQIRLI